MKAPVLAVVGNIVGDVIVHPVDTGPVPGRALAAETIALVPGGCGYHTAAAAARLGMATRLIGSVGDDLPGQLVRRRLSGYRTLDSTEVKVVRRTPTTLTVVLVSGSGQRSFLITLGSALLASLSPAGKRHALSARHLHLAGFSLVPAVMGAKGATLLREARARGMTTSLDLAWRADVDHRAALDPCLPYTDIAMPNLDEAEAATGQRGASGASRWLLEMGVGTVLITMGEEGVHVADDGMEAHVGAYRVAVTDTTGAGDAFAGGFLAATLRPDLVPRMLTAQLGDLLARVLYAQACGALACTGLGGEAGPTGAAAVKAFLKRNPVPVIELIRGPGVHS